MTSTASRVDRRARPRGRRDPVAGVLGVLGDLLITLGVLLGLFVVWQLWWTDVAAGRVQDRVVEDLGWARTATAPEPAVAPGATHGSEPITEPATEPLGDPPVLEEPVHATAFATLAVPRWGEDYLQPVSQGVSRDVLDSRGLGHYPGTAMPGAVGNFAVAGHRVTYGRPLHRVEELRPGDPLVVQTEDAWFVYRVTSTRVVQPTAVDVIAPVPGREGEEPTTAVMTLTTCHPMYSARERFVVHAELDRWLPGTHGPPAELIATGQGEEN